MPKPNPAPLPPIHFSPHSEQVLVTGGTGFVGQHLIRALLANGQQVTLLTRNAQAASAQFDGKVRCISNMATLPPETRIDVIVNLAGARILGQRWTEKRKAILRASRVGLTAGLIDWIERAQHKPRLLLSASAIGYYGIQAQNDASRLHEDSSPQAIFMSQLCQEWEVQARRACDYGVNVATMRFGLVMGHGGALPMMLLPINLGLGGRLGSGRQSLPWIHIHDLLRAIAHVWQGNSGQGQFQAWNFTAPGIVSQLEFSQIAARVLKRPCFMPTPAWPMRLLLGEQADLLLEGQRAYPARLLESGFQFGYTDLYSALQSLR